MGRPIKDKYFGNTSGSGEQIQGSAWVVGGSGAEAAYIMKQRSSRRYVVHTATGNDTCILVDSAPAAAGEMTVAVWPAGGNSGAGATAGTITMTVTTANINIAGTGYSANNIVTVTGGAGTSANLKITGVDGNGNVTSLSINYAGNYSNIANIVLAAPTTGGDGANLTVDLKFGVRTIPVSAGGSDYLAAPTVVITGANTTPAVATATLSGQTVSTVTVSNFGDGYVAKPTVTFVPVGSATVEYARKISAHKVVTFTGNVYSWTLQDGNVITLYNDQIIDLG